ncbi:hypothetical protein PM082_008622 [Marasmius tenuissimus]|nr:hypothetical protein PM082_008622 [Marasmius tenuissimus]
MLYYTSSRFPFLQRTKHIPPLPVDIIDLLLDVVRHDSNLLSSCSLVSRTWLLRTRPRMFSKVVVMNRTRMARLLILMKSPYCTLRPYLQQMAIDPERDNELWLHSFLNLVSMKGISLRHLTLPTFPRSGPESLAFDPRNLPLTSLHINIRQGTVEEIMQFVCIFSDSLECLALRIHSPHISHSRRSISMGGHRLFSFPRLRRLSLEGAQPVVQSMDWLSQYANLKRVSSLYVGLGLDGDCHDRYDVDCRIATFLNSSCTTVETLSLDFDWVSPVSRLDLSGLYKLRAIRIKWTGGNPRDISQAADIIRSAHTAPLTTVQLLNFDFGRSRKTIEAALPAWTYLDDLLSSRKPLGFPYLREVVVTPGRLMGLLPRCQNCGYLTNELIRSFWKFDWDRYISEERRVHHSFRSN